MTASIEASQPQSSLSVDEARPNREAGTLTLSHAASLAELMTEMASAEAVVASRFHNVVCALRLAKPTVSVAYAPKNDDLMEQFGLGAFCQSIDTLDVDALISQLDEVISQHASSEPRMRATVERYADQLEAQFALLSQALLGETSVTQKVMT